MLTSWRSVVPVAGLIVCNIVHCSADLTAAAVGQDSEVTPTIHDAAVDEALPDRHPIDIPTVDISGATNVEDRKRHVVLASGSNGQNWQHPHMLLMPDGKTIYAVWTLGHGGTCGPIKRSDDAGVTWSECQPVPKNWATVRNCPTIHRLVDSSGKARLFVFAGVTRSGFFNSTSLDDGRTWSPMQKNEIHGEVSPMTILPVSDGTKHLAWFHTNTVVQVESEDGGITWRNPRTIVDAKRFPGAFPCEPEVIRSPNGEQLLMLMRENSRQYNSLYAVSDDEGEHWSDPRELPASLTGDRHTAVYAEDGRLVVMFRNRRPVPEPLANGEKAGVPVWSGPTTAWVGRYEDVIQGQAGQYRVTLLPYGGYGKLQRLPDGAILAVSYCRYLPEDQGSSIVLTRFRMDHLDQRFREQARRSGEFENILLHQRTSGGWPKNYDRHRVLTESQRRTSESEQGKQDAVIDNGATHTEIRLLARAYSRSTDPRHRESALRGIRYLLNAQYANGGWPQRFPEPSGYARYITFNDNAMIGVASLLRDVAERREPFEFVPEDVCWQCRRAVDRCVRCILNCQILVDGEPTVWCAQHDHVTFEPRPARSYEVASLSGSESVGIVRFLMHMEEDPEGELSRAIRGAMHWFERAKLKGIKQIRVAKTASEKGFDKRVVVDPSAPPIWARFYDIETNQPIFCSRDGVPRRTLAEISYERRVGYSWLGYYATDLLQKEFPAWRARIVAERNP